MQSREGTPSRRSALRTLGPAPTSPPASARIRATIVATIGPASDSPESVARLIEAGVAIFRINFSHGSLQDHGRRLSNIRAVAEVEGRPIAVLGDLQGPKIRVGRVESPGVTVETGSLVEFDPAAEVARVERRDAESVTVLPTGYAPMTRDVRPGQRVLVNDGLIRMLAIEGGSRLLCRVTSGGLVTSKKGINLPESVVSAPAITGEDWTNAQWAVEHGLDFLALSFVRSADEVLELKRRLRELCPVNPDNKDEYFGGASTIPVIAKIEKPQAVAELEKIVEASDGIMVARGDLGVEMDIAQVPVVQKRIVSVCRDWGRPCIVATQMLETMTESSSPTRAEASDVANAIFDGADAVMLSAETATGKHPTLVVETMARIVRAAEERIDEQPYHPGAPARLVAIQDRIVALAHGAWHVAHDTAATLVVCWSQLGQTATALSSIGFRVPIIAYSSNERATRRMAILRGVTPVFTPTPKTPYVADFIDYANSDMIRRGLARPGDRAVFVAGKPVGTPGATNAVITHTFT